MFIDRATVLTQMHTGAVRSLAELHVAIFVQKLGKAKRNQLERAAEAGQPTTVTGSVVAEPVRVFDQETCNDHILYVAFQTFADELRGMEMPDKPQELGNMLATLVPVFIAKTQQVVDQCDGLLAKMTPKERMQWEAEAEAGYDAYTKRQRMKQH